MVEDQLRIAADMIRNRRYDEARRLLVTIDHPKAREWIARIDQMPRGAAPAPSYAPSTPAPAYATPAAYAPVAAPVMPAEQRGPGLGAALMALIGALLGALIGAAIWAAVAYFTDTESGYVALIVGGLAGGGAVLFSGRRRGPVIQLIGVLAALLGIAVGKYVAIYFLAVRAFAPEAPLDAMLTLVPPFSADMVSAIIEDIRVGSNILDLVFVALAAFAAFRIAARGR